MYTFIPILNCHALFPVSNSKVSRPMFTGAQVGSPQVDLAFEVSGSARVGSPRVDLAFEVSRSAGWVHPGSTWLG